MKSAEYYAGRIYNLAVLDPDVNAMDGEEVEAHTEKMADELCLNPEPVLDEVRKIQPTTTEFQKASEITEELSIPQTNT